MDHLSLEVADVAELDAWRRYLGDQTIEATYAQSDWGHQVKFRAPENIAVELFVLAPAAAETELTRLAAVQT